MLTIAQTSVAGLSIRKLRVLRATMNDSDAADFELLDKVIGELSKELGLTEEQAEKRLSAYIQRKLDEDNAATQKRWQARVNDEENGAAAVHSDGDPSDFS